MEESMIHLLFDGSQIYIVKKISNEIMVNRLMPVFSEAALTLLY